MRPPTTRAAPRFSARELRARRASPPTPRACAAFVSARTTCVQRARTWRRLTKTRRSCASSSSIPARRLPRTKTRFRSTMARDGRRRRRRRRPGRARSRGHDPRVLGRDARRPARNTTCARRGLVAELGDALASLSEHRPTRRRRRCRGVSLRTRLTLRPGARRGRAGALGDAFAGSARGLARACSRLNQRLRARRASGARDAEALERRRPRARRLEASAFLRAETRSARCASPRTPSRTRCASSSPRSRVSAGTSRTSRSRFCRRWRRRDAGVADPRRGPAPVRGAHGSPKRRTKPPPAAWVAARLAAALPRARARGSRRVGAAHALDASIPSLASASAVACPPSPRHRATFRRASEPASFRLHDALGTARLGARR